MITSKVYQFHVENDTCYTQLMFTLRLFRNIVCEFGPISAFLIAFQIAGFQTGIIAMMIATVLAMITLRLTEGHIPLFALLSSATVLGFGGLSVISNMPTLFILRDTLFDAVFGIALIISVALGRPLFYPLFRTVFAITPQGWHTLSLRWGIFFLILAITNEWVRLTFSPEDWVFAKVGIIIASVAFGSYQFTLTKRERLSEATPWGIVR